LSDGLFIHWDGGLPRINDSKIHECFSNLRLKLLPSERGIADKAYVKFPELMTPIKGKNLFEAELVYNSVVSSV
jgi:hypothetical protein